MEDKALIFPILAIVLLISQTPTAANESSVPPAYTTFIKTKCNITLTLRENTNALCFYRQNQP